jgi:hypothetical protein
MDAMAPCEFKHVSTRQHRPGPKQCAAFLVVLLACLALVVIFDSLRRIGLEVLLD